MAVDGITEIKVLADTISVTTPAGGTVEPRGKTAHLLALLVSRANEPVAVDDIIRTVWPEVHDPALIDTKQVEKLVSGLRSLLGDNAREAIPPRKHDRYRLDPGVPGIWVDAVEFGRLATAAQAGLDAGEPAQARSDGRRALDLWKGDPVVLPGEWKHLRERHRKVRRAAAEAAVRLGAPVEAAAELESYVADQPADERGWELLVEAYLLGDRPSEARRAGLAAAGQLEAYGGVGGQLRSLCRQADERDGVAAEPAPSANDAAGGTEPNGATRAAHAPAPVGRRRMRWWLPAVLVGGTAAVAAFVIASALRDPPAPVPRTAVSAVAFDFDRGIQTEALGRYVVDSTTQIRGYEVPNSGGAVALVEHGAGQAVKFPPPCGGRTVPECPGAIIDTADAEFLNPGSRPFSYGAEILVGEEDGARGANIIQKGVGTSPTNPDPNQWKLELGREGEAQCVLVTQRAEAGPPITATSHLVVNDGRWHRVGCTKTDTVLSIVVDGSDPVSVPVPPGLALISPSEPLRLGGNNRMGANRFTGAVDDVYYRLD